MARPTIRTPEIIEKIADRLSCGESLVEICDDPQMPDRSTVNRWRDQDDALCDRFVRARARGQEWRVDEARLVADDGRNDWMEKRGKDGEKLGWQVNGEAIQRSKLRVETIYREAEALAPKVFSKRQIIEHQGGLDLNVSRATDDELVEEMINLLSTGRLKLPPGFELVDSTDEDELDDPDGVG